MGNSVMASAIMMLAQGSSDAFQPLIMVGIAVLFSFMMFIVYLLMGAVNRWQL
jgi:hypothetical protein